MKDLTGIDFKLGPLMAAETQMDDYEKAMSTVPYNKDNWAYLHVAETNLIIAEGQGIDTTAQRARLTGLIKKYKPQL